MHDPWGAMFRPDAQRDPLASGLLDGTTFAVKETFDLAGFVTAAGNPDWLRTHDPALADAEVITRLLCAGASLTGKTHTDELMYSLNGENAHYGTPKNPRAAGRIPGGSSSGSAVAVAAGMTTFALGTDTGGSVRVPSSYCGIYGIRPTQGRVDSQGVLKLAPSFCTVGWMASTADVLETVGKVLLGNESNIDEPFHRCLVATDALGLVSQHVREQVLIQAARLSSRMPVTAFARLSDEGLDWWQWAFRIIQGREIWATHGEWIEAVKPTFGPGIAERCAWAKTLTSEQQHLAEVLRGQVRAKLAELLDGDTLLVLPSAPGPAPVLSMPEPGLTDWRNQALQLTCIAGLGGLPQVTVPWIWDDGLPIGLSFVAGLGQDRRLLHFVRSLDEVLAS